MPTTDPLIEVIADAIVDADTLTGDLMPAARAVLAAIQATGRLLGPGAVIVATTESTPWDRDEAADYLADILDDPQAWQGETARAPAAAPPAPDTPPTTETGA